MIISTLLRVCHKTGSFRRNYVLLSGVGGSETSCLDSVGETTQICWILTLEHNSVEMIILFSILHCTESRYYPEKLWNILFYMGEVCQEVRFWWYFRELTLNRQTKSCSLKISRVFTLKGISIFSTLGYPLHLTGDGLFTKLEILKSVRALIVPFWTPPKSTFEWQLHLIMPRTRPSGGTTFSCRKIG